MTAAPSRLNGEAIDAANAENFVDFFTLLGAVPGAEQKICDGFVRVSAPVPHPFYNFVYGFDALARGSDLDAAIGEALAPFRARNCPMMWIVFPAFASGSERLIARLAAAGLTSFGEYRGMAVDLSAAVETSRPATDLVIERVADAETMRQWVEVQVACDSRTHERIKEVRVRQAAARGFDPADRQRTYLARLAGAPVGGAILHVAARAAGVYQVATLPEARRRGVACAMTRQALFEGRARGCRLGVLHATPMAESLYRSIGFVDRSPVKVFIDLPSPP